MVEHETALPKTKRRTTNYVVLLNLSTEPVSVWLMFDYHLEDFAEVRYRRTNRLGEYHNELFKHLAGSMGPRSGPKLRDEFDEYEDSLIQYERFRELYTNMEDMRPTAYREKLTEITGEISNIAHDGGNAVASGEPKHENGYFGLPALFDLALLAPDATTWHVDGLNQEQVKKCLDSSYFRLGSSLRARTAEDAEVQELQNKRIDIKALCFKQT